ncbi:hypothetical protein, partial [Bacillus mycoides]|uniref:hypothetical protein n=1 Tax=Bacillus mycoides TaxID=1405 RepID=UPI003A809838
MDTGNDKGRFRNDLDLKKGSALDRFNNQPDEDLEQDSGLSSVGRSEGEQGTGYGNSESREIGDAGFYAEESDQEEIE